MTSHTANMVGGPVDDQCHSPQVVTSPSNPAQVNHSITDLSLPSTSSLQSTVSSSSLTTQGPVTRSLSRGVVRKQSIKRKAPAPPPLSVSSSPPPSESFDQYMNRPKSPECGAGPPAPLRTQASRKATKKLQELSSPNSGETINPMAQTLSSLSEYEINHQVHPKSPDSTSFPHALSPVAAVQQQFSNYPYTTCGEVIYQSSNPSLNKGITHSTSEGSVHRGPVVPVGSSSSGPLIPLVEEAVSPDGSLVPNPHYQQEQDNLEELYGKIRGGPSREENPDDAYSQLYYGNSSSRKPRLTRSDSVITVAHLCEDLYVVTPFIRVTLTNLTGMVVVVALIMPNTAAMLYTFFRLVFGTLFPAYYSYKAVKTKNVKEYVKWMMYWIVFAFFTCCETITDLFLAFWFPFYYELKILLVLWLLSPATRGSSVLYRKFVHPWLTQREDDIDECIAKAKQQGYSTVLTLGTKGVNYATSVIMQTAIKGGGGIVNQLKRSYSVGELAITEEGEKGDHNSNNVKHNHHHDVTDYHTGTTPQPSPNTTEADTAAPVIACNANGAKIRSASRTTPPLHQSFSFPSPIPAPVSEEQSSSDEIIYEEEEQPIARRRMTRTTSARSRLF